MKLKIDNKDYEIIIASDVSRDGIGLEIWDSETNRLIIEKSLKILIQRLGNNFKNNF